MQNICLFITKIKILGVLFLILTMLVLFSEKSYSKEIMLLSGLEKLHNFGLDTTGNWWAITMPFTGRYRLHINGNESDAFSNVYPPLFSADGQKWASFYEHNGFWGLMTIDSIYELMANKPGEVYFSGNSQKLIYSYFSGSLETIVLGDKKVEVTNRVGKLFIDYTGSRYAFLGYRGSSYVLNINGYETSGYDDIKPIGYWNDGKFIYAVRNGNLWQVYKDKKPITESYYAIYEQKINIFGTVATFIAKTGNGKNVVVTLSDEYYEPLVGGYYDSIIDLVLHPYSTMVAYRAIDRTNQLIIFNNTVYSCYRNCGSPKFSVDGDLLYFITCDLECYLVINGKRYPMNTELEVKTTLAIKPNSNTYALSSNYTLIKRYLEKKDFELDFMVDYTITPIYNRFADTYETLGTINDRLYMLVQRAD